MAAFAAAYYDGHTSVRKDVACDVVEGELRIEGDGVLARLPLASIAPEAPIAGAPRILALPDGARLHVEDVAAVDALFPRAHPLERAVHALERHWPAALASLAAVAAFSWWFVVHGLPALATRAADLVPPKLEAELGASTLASIDGRLCGPSSLAPARQAALQRRFADLAAGAGDGYAYRLHLRACGAVGPNAFALPGGIVVMTDALVTLAQNDDQLSAVLAHEIGHVRGRHGLRQVLQAAGLAALTAALFGDAVSIAGLAASLPGVLLQTGYSRRLEGEADEYAFARLKEVGISPVAFAEMMERLDPGRKGGGAGEASGGYFATHPPTARRIERARDAAR